MNIYVGNLPYNIDEDTVNSLFAEYGEVFSVKLIKDHETGRHKGFGFVEMDQNGGKKAIENLNDTEINNRNIVVNVARDKKDRQDNFRKRF